MSILSAARQFFSESPATAKQKLLIGGKLLSAALMFADDWTPASVDKASGLKALLLDGRKLDQVVEEMTEHAASVLLKRFTADITHLADEIERAKRKKRPARMPTRAASSRGAAQRRAKRR